jgi:uncharacterized protein YjbI with pentapeptide repeats
MAVHSDVDWVTCTEGACVGVQLPSGDRCWAHADRHDLDAALVRLREGDDLDGRGVAFTAGLLERVLDAVPNDDGRVVVTYALFDRATFEDRTDFSVAKFEGDAAFVEATFRGNASFEGAAFAGYADFEGATFAGDVSFEGAAFAGYVDFDGTTFAGDGDFKKATFAGEVTFEEATFGGEAGFTETTFAGDARFYGAAFEADARFNGTMLEREVIFERVRFMDTAGFDQASFTGHASFLRTTFTSSATFEGAMFEHHARFDRATFKRDATFRQATFSRVAAFGRAAFMGTAEFTEATFTGPAGFSRGLFKDNTWFNQAIFEREATFGRARFEGEARFRDATFERARQLGPMVVHMHLDLDGALFHERIQIEVSTAILSCRRTRFLAGVQLRVRRAQVVLDDADLAAPSVVSSANPFPRLSEGDWPQTVQIGWRVDHHGTPRLLSVRGADVAGLTVAGVDLRACRFVDAHHLDQLRAEASNFPTTPRGWRWTRRRTIAEEQQWRASKGGHGWYRLQNQPPEWFEVKERSGPDGLLLPGDIARLYRELRKGLEDSKDEPGAADLYYGEMEMRRHDKRRQVHLERNGGIGSSAAAEYAILSLYWLVSGYALRAWRALTSLAAVLLVASVIFAFWGFAAPDQPAPRPVAVDAQGALVYESQPRSDRPAGWDELPTALRYSAQATTALLRGPDVRALTPIGEWLQIALRLLGPVLLGLAVLSVRGRVKR